MKKKIILATVNAKKNLYAATADEFSAIAPNLQMGLLTAYIKSKNIDVDMIDSELNRISIDGLIDIIEKEEPLLLGIICSGANPSSSTMTMSGVIEFFNKFKQRNLKVISFVWGAHPTVLPERTLRETNADFIVRGEGYETIVELFNALSCNSKIDNEELIKFRMAGISYLQKIGLNAETKYIQNNDVPLLKNLDELPMVDWETMHPSKYRAHNWHCFGDINNRTPYAIIWTSFGCSFKCVYCSINNLFGRRIQRFRSVDSVIKEISVLVEKYNVKHLKILDELFVINPKRMDEFCDRLEEKGYNLNMWAYSRVDTINRHLLKRLKKVGLNWISYGFETATPEILKSIEKGCAHNYDEVVKMTQDEGLSICADVMCGLPDDDADAMKRTYDFLVKYNFEWVNIYPMFAYPGTKLFKDTGDANLWKTYALYGYECSPAGTKYLTPKEALKFRDETFAKYHSRSEYLSMIEKKFGVDTKDHIIKMDNTPLKRKILESNV